jgi:hypothetical protein
MHRHHAFRPDVERRRKTGRRNRQAGSIRNAASTESFTFSAEKESWRQGQTNAEHAAFCAAGRNGPDGTAKDHRRGQIQKIAVSRFPALSELSSKAGPAGKPTVTANP